MTLEEVSHVMEHGVLVDYQGGEYIVTGVITRYGRQPGMAPEVKAGWWYQAELTGVRPDRSVVIARIEDVETA